MPSDPVWIPEGTPASSSTPVSGVKRASPDLTTTTTADPGASGTTLAVTSAARFPSTNGYQVRVEAEIMLVTAGAGTASWTVTRAQEGTTGVAHASGVTVALIELVQNVQPVSAGRETSFLGRAASFRTPGIAGTTGQKLFAIHNATGSPVLVNIKKITIDLAATVVKAVTVLPPVVRLWRFTAVPTNGTALAKVAEDTALTSNAAVTLWQGASADGTSSGTALTVTLPASNIMAEAFAPRLITAAGYEPWDRHVFLEAVDDAITLRSLQGMCVFLDYVLATQNPTTDMWTVGVEWEEYRSA